MLCKSQFFTFAPKRQKIDLPSLGGHVFGRELTAGETIDYSAHQANGRPREAVVHLLTTAISDENGNPLFSQEDAAALMSMNPILAGELVSGALRVAGMDKPAATEARAESEKKPVAGG